MRHFGVVEDKASITSVRLRSWTLSLCTLKNKNGLIDEQMMEEKKPPNRDYRSTPVTHAHSRL
jgi:hypothetical protein